MDVWLRPPRGQGAETSAAPDGNLIDCGGSEDGVGSPPGLSGWNQLRAGRGLRGH